MSGSQGNGVTDLLETYFKGSLGSSVKEGKIATSTRQIVTAFLTCGFWWDP